MEKIFTAKELKKAAVEAGIDTVAVRECTLCGHPVSYIVHRGELFFDSNCDCTRYYVAPEQRSWNDLAVFINMQHDDSVKRKLAESFGIKF